MKTLERTDTADWTKDYDAMAQAALKLTSAEVAERVRPYVANMVLPSMPDITFSVGETGIHLSHGYWRIPIHPSRDPENLTPFILLLGELDDKLRECEGFLVTIETGDPLNYD